MPTTEAAEFVGYREPPSDRELLAIALLCLGGIVLLVIGCAVSVKVRIWE